MRPTVGATISWAKAFKKGRCAMSAYAIGMFVMFLMMLVGLLLFHHHKLWVVMIGFITLSLTFKEQHNGWHTLVNHFMEHHRSHLLFNLWLLLPAFALVAYYFEHSGASHGLAKILKSDVALLWVVFLLSTVLDNIAAALIGGTIVLAKYGAPRVPFLLLIGVIGASNLGGAGSPVGDTTTVMMFISENPKIPVSNIFMAFIATIPAQILLTMLTTKHGISAQSGEASAVVEEMDLLESAAHRTGDDAATGHAEAEGLAGSQHAVQWSQMWPMLAIPGLIIGNLQDQPGLGVWAGLVIGLALAKREFEWKVFKEALPNTGFLLLLVGAAEMLPLNSVKPMLNTMPRDIIAILMGLLSAWFDNIPLTAVCLALKDFDWGLLAYCVGYGGSAMWFGSSAGVAMGLLFPQIYDTKKWGWPFLIVTATYMFGAFVYLIVKHSLPSVLDAFANLSAFYKLMTCFGGCFLSWALAGACWPYPGKVSAERKVGMLIFAFLGAGLLVAGFGVMKN
ncbi:hypothetical protein FJZ27_03470 [Candidatus Peribacteria bacterium]|nr:hypothetical protein [Candidatus Peribacteria bacterium]